MPIDKNIIDRLIADFNNNPDSVFALTDSPDPEVRKELAKHNATPVRVLTVLAYDKNGEVRKAVFDNPRSSKAVKEMLKNECV